ncbi:4'-phosphopantetheinyl transferase family protein [Streptacidiphilus jiangxiensis]|uniref:4'-phosphopantetheinyl transferase n=1 Tax=Streptacidiphilus jiangxiensis TaxID=235985 RepID=A0A1H7JKF9_STRJI|nr:4'-phosphopantetheinyl transferase superfamily protein [Streptacidiphilus jiangxiensis]SEK74347.1 4'-phosphopantetheinyl transferase [Streptacidiphilus jiangxiensis]
MTAARVELWHLGPGADVRPVLARRVGADPSALAWDLGPHGKPGPVEPGGLHWNLSHSGEHTLLALSPDGPVGVDIQRVRERPDPLAAARRFLPAAESERIARAADPREAYHRALCRREAWAKADGRRLLDVLRLTPRGVLDLDAPPGYVAALAVTGGRAPLLRHVSKGSP